MVKYLHLFIFDIKLLRYLYCFPFVSYGLCAILMLMVGTQSNSPYLSYIFIEGIAIPLAGWHLIFLYNSVFEEGAEESLIDFYRQTLTVDLVRYAILHGVFISLLVVLMARINEPGFFTITLTAHLLLLFFFYQLIGLAILSSTKSLEITLATIATYTFMEVVTQGTFMPWPHIFIFIEPINDIWLQLTFFSLGTGIILSIIQLWRKFYSM